MSRKNIIEIITKIKDVLNEVYQLTDNDTLNENIKKVFNDVEQLRQPITLADFLGWEEGVAYEIFGEKLIIKDDGLWFIREGNLRCSTDISWSKHNITTLRQAKKVKPKKYYAKIKGWEIHVDNRKVYWRGNIITKKTLVGFNDTSNLQDYTPVLTKEEWNELGIDDSNADFEEVKYDTKI